MKTKNITKKEVEHMLNLARLLSNEEEKAKIQRDLSAILDFVDQLNEVDTAGIRHSDKDVLLKNILRPDRGEPADPKIIDRMLSQFSDKNNRFLKVKEILSNV